MIRLLQFILMLSDEELQSLGIQDAALCDLWLSERRQDAPRIEDEDKLPGTIEKWIETADTQELQTEGRRHQTLLRELLDIVHQGNADTLGRDELLLLLKVYDLACRAKNSHAFERICKGLERHIDKIRQRYESLPPERGLPNLSQRFRVVNTDDIRKARAQEVRMVAGVELPSRGPVLRQRGHLRVLGDVPESATLVVEDGDCVVDGYVMGRVAVSGGCEVLENVCGVVIARNGDIRARNIVDGAFVVSKRGWIHCRRAQRAKLIFGGECISIRDATLEGRLFSKTIRIENEVEGGEIHVGAEITADRFVQSVNRPLNIIFRNRLSCKDYGENPGREMSSDVSRVMRLRSKLNFTNQQMVLALSEAEQFAANAITHLLVGGDIAVLMDNMVAAQARLNVVNRIILSLNALYSAAACSLEASQDQDLKEAVLPGGSDTVRLLDELDGDIDRLQEGAEADDSVREERESIANFRKSLFAGGSSPLALRNTLGDVGQKLARWRKEAAELKETISQNEAKTRAVLQANNLLIEDSKKKSKLLALKEIITKVQNDPSDSAVARRVSDTFTALMLRSIRSRIEFSRKFRTEIKDLRAQFHDSKAEIWEAYQMDIGEEDESQIEMRAMGKFDPGVRLLADPVFLNSETPPGPGVSVTTSSNNGETMVFVCQSGIISEMPREEPAPVAG
ncbi:MAG: polymer-forming cytoskeletal protein [Candidatus Hydrogenedentes bacterium]|nr:polymer-forming cytoskeletal protein [Candidatus Hydrogenedentota bacterium]